MLKKSHPAFSVSALYASPSKPDGMPLTDNRRLHKTGHFDKIVQLRQVGGQR
jgi:hypothetical protein